MKSSLGHYEARRALFDIENNMKYQEEDLYKKKLTECQKCAILDY